MPILIQIFDQTWRLSSVLTEDPSEADPATDRGRSAGVDKASAGLQQAVNGRPCAAGKCTAALFFFSSFTAAQGVKIFNRFSHFLELK